MCTYPFLYSNRDIQRKAVGELVTGSFFLLKGVGRRGEIVAKVEKCMRPGDVLFEEMKCRNRSEGRQKEEERIYFRSAAPKV